MIDPEIKIEPVFDEPSKETNYKVLVPKAFFEGTGVYRIGTYCLAATPKTDSHYVFTSHFSRTPEQAHSRLLYHLDPAQAEISSLDYAAYEKERRAHESVATPIRTAVQKYFRDLEKKALNTAIQDLQATNTPAIWLYDYVVTERGKYHVDDKGILKCFQELSKVGFLANLDTIERSSQDEGIYWEANEAAKSILEKVKAERLIKDMEKEAKAKEAAEQEAKKQAMYAKYCQEITSVDLPKGEKRSVMVPRCIASGTPTFEPEEMTVHGHLAIRKNTLKNPGKHKYFITHVATGLSLGNELKIETLGQAKEFIKALIHTGLDLSKKQFSNDELNQLLEVKRTLFDGTSTAPETWQKKGFTYEFTELHR